MNKELFISHATEDDQFVKELRLSLEDLQITVWADSRELVGGDQLEEEIVKAIEGAQYFIVVLSFNTYNSTWVKKEVDKALEFRRSRATIIRLFPFCCQG